VTAEGHAQTLDPLAADEIYCIGREAIVNAIRLPICGGVAMIPGPNQTLLLGARDVDMEHIASYLPTLASEGRPVVDGTGLTGTFDFSINWVSGSPSSASSATAAPLDNSGPTFEEALREQLGLKLKSVRAPVRTLVIDHVEPLSPN
jgi:bla regulator protein BlaR1